MPTTPVPPQPSPSDSSGLESTSPTAELKFAHGVRIANDLTGRIGEWQASETLLARAQQVDSYTIEWRFVLKAEPPVDEWSLLLGDMMHNFRSIYDTVAWAFAHVDGAIPKHPQAVEFPLTETEAKWNQKVKRFESVPVDLLERMRSLQSWANGGQRPDSLLWLLHRFDILDKHQGLISGKVHIDQLATDGVGAGIPPEAQLNVTLRKDPIEAKNDAVFATWHSPVYPISIDTDYRAQVRANFRISTGDDRGTFIATFVNELIDRTREYLDILTGGRMWAATRLAARKSTEAELLTARREPDGTITILRMPLAPKDS